MPAVQLSHSHGWHRPGPSSEDKLPAANACSAAPPLFVRVNFLREYFPATSHQGYPAHGQQLLVANEVVSRQYIYHLISERNRETSRPRRSKVNTVDHGNDVNPNRSNPDLKNRAWNCEIRTQSGLWSGPGNRARRANNLSDCVRAACSVHMPMFVRVSESSHF